MASPMAVAVMTKKALELAEDKRVRTLLASIAAGIVIVMLIPLLVMVSIFNTQAGFSQEVARIVFDGGPISTDIDAELSKAMEEMMDAFEELDQTIETLEEEGFDDIANLFEGVAAIEKEHEERYLKLLANVEGGLVFSRDGDMIWQCSNCGHVCVGKQAPEVCPVCAHPQAYFQIKANNY